MKGEGIERGSGRFMFPSPERVREECDEDVRTCANWLLCMISEIMMSKIRHELPKRVPWSEMCVSFKSDCLSNSCMFHDWQISAACANVDDVMSAAGWHVLERLEIVKDAEAFVTTPDTKFFNYSITGCIRPGFAQIRSAL